MNRMISFGYGYKDGKLIVVESEAENCKKHFYGLYKRKNSERNCGRIDH